MSSNRTITYTLLFYLFTTVVLKAQLRVSFATWKDNSKAAYSIIHDDFGVPNFTNGIQDYADTIAFNNDVKISFGPITNAVNSATWQIGRKMLTHGHEVLNHTHSHKCAIDLSWCTNGFYTNVDFPLELDSSTALITRNMYIKPLFFIHPFDLFTNDIQSHLKTLGYIGTRTGISGADNNAAFDPYQINFRVLQPTDDQSILTGELDAAIDKGAYLMRELHGVADASWASVKLEEYRNHIKHVKELQDKGYLWCATPTEVINYRMQYTAYDPTVNYNISSGTINILFTEKLKIDTTVLRIPITVILKLDALDGSYTITQGNTVISNYSKRSDTLLINVYPHRGSLLLKRNADSNLAPAVAFIAPSMNLVIDKQSAISFKIKATDLDGTITAVSLYDNDVLIDVLTQAPYLINWMGASSGIHEIKAKAVDNKGAVSFATLKMSINGTSGIATKKRMEQLATVAVFPNPFINYSIIHYTLKQHVTTVKLKIINMLGVEVYIKNLSNNNNPGNYTYNIDDFLYNSGIYFVCIEIDGMVHWIKVLKQE